MTKKCKSPPRLPQKILQSHYWLGGTKLFRPHVSLELRRRICWRLNARRCSREPTTTGLKNTMASLVLPTRTSSNTLRQKKSATICHHSRFISKYTPSWHQTYTIHHGLFSLLRQSNWLHYPPSTEQNSKCAEQANRTNPRQSTTTNGLSQHTYRHLHTLPCEQHGLTNR